MERVLTEEEWAHELRTFDLTAFRLEVQPTYAVPGEAQTVERFLAGEPEPPTEAPWLRAWFEQVAALVAGGKRIKRVRVHDDPPTPYQRWVRWIDRWNTAAGEEIRYLDRTRAHEIGLLPAAGTVDWWLMDEDRLVVMRFDDQGRRVESRLVRDPARVAQACAWRDLAVHHSTSGEARRDDA